MSARRQPFSGSWIISDWFEDEAAQAAARRRRILQATAGIVLSAAALIGFGAMAYFSVEKSTANSAAKVAPASTAADRF